MRKDFSLIFKEERRKLQKVIKEKSRTIDHSSMSQTRPKKILVRMPNWVGDAVCAEPVLRRLRSGFPEAKITISCVDLVSSLFFQHQAVDQRIGLPPSFREMRREKYDMGILLTHSFSSAWIFWRGRVRRRIGFAKDGRRWLLSTPLSFPKTKEHMVITYQRVIDAVGLVGKVERPHLRILEEERKKVEELVPSFTLREGVQWIGIHPGASYGLAKCWPPERFRELMSRLLKMDSTLVLFLYGTSSQRKLIDQIGERFSSRVVNMAGKTTLRELMILMERSTLLVTNDSGPMHIADALGIPLVALFGSTDSLVTGPFRAKDSPLVGWAPCSPCFLRTCPIDLRCMKAISVDMVLDRIKEIFFRKENRA